MMRARRPVGCVTLEKAADKLSKRGILTGRHLIFGQLRSVGMLNGHRADWKAAMRGWLKERSGLWLRGEATGSYVRVFMTKAGLDEAERRLRAAGLDKPEVSEIDVKEFGMEPGKFGF